MALNLDFEFIYFRRPTIVLDVISLANLERTSTTALIDTGAEVSLFDNIVAETLGLDLGDAPRMRMFGIARESLEARLMEVEVQLLGSRDLSVVVEVAFAPNVESVYGNLLGLDILSTFDLALSHANRMGYLGVASRP